MCQRVIADHMPRIARLLHKRARLGGAQLFANHKKHCRDASAREHRKHPGCRLRLRPIVEAEAYLLSVCPVHCRSPNRHYAFVWSHFPSRQALPLGLEMLRVL